MELTIARNDGHETNWLTEIDSTLTSDQAYEFILWSDGSMSIDGLVGDKFENDQTRLDLAAVRQLRDFLNSPRIVETLAEQ